MLASQRYTEIIVCVSGHICSSQFTYLGQTPHLGGHYDDDAVCVDRGSE